MTRFTAVLALALSFGLLITGCDSGLTGEEAPPDQQSENAGPLTRSVPQSYSGAVTKGRNGGVVQQEAALVVTDVREGEEPYPVGTASLKRKSDNDNIQFTLDVSGLPQKQNGHAYTVWWGNLPLADSQNPDGDGGGGWGGGGVVRDGKFTVSNNHCTWDLETFWDGGFRPGTKPNCDRIDASEAIIFVVLIHDEWQPGDMMERWDPDGDPETVDPDDPKTPGDLADECDFGTQPDECDSFKKPYRTIVASFGPLED